MRWNINKYYKKARIRRRPTNTRGKKNKATFDYPKYAWATFQPHDVGVQSFHSFRPLRPPPQVVSCSRHTLAGCGPASPEYLLPQFGLTGCDPSADFHRPSPWEPNTWMESPPLYGSDQLSFWSECLCAGVPRARTSPRGWNPCCCSDSAFIYSGGKSTHTLVLEYWGV